MTGLRWRPFASVVLAGLALAAAGAARAECPPFPDVPWWRGLSHRSVIEHVDRNYGGDWKAYTDAWDRRLVKLQEIQLKGSTAVIRTRTVRSGQVRLNGPKLDSYVDTVRRRVAIIRCLESRARAR